MTCGSKEDIAKTESTLARSYHDKSIHISQSYRCLARAYHDKSIHISQLQKERVYYFMRIFCEIKGKVIYIIYFRPKYHLHFFHETVSYLPDLQKIIIPSIDIFPPFTFTLRAYLCHQHLSNLKACLQQR